MTHAYANSACLVSCGMGTRCMGPHPQGGGLPAQAGHEELEHCSLSTQLLLSRVEATILETAHVITCAWNASMNALNPIPFVCSPSVVCPPVINMEIS